MSLQASVSVKRVGEFLRCEELDPDIVNWRREPAMGESETTAPILSCKQQLI